MLEQMQSGLKVLKQDTYTRFKSSKIRHMHQVEKFQDTLAPGW